MFHAVGEQIDNLLGGIGDTCLLHGQRVVGEFLCNAAEPLGQLGAGKLTGALNLPAVDNGHDTGDHRHMNSLCQNPVHKVIEHIVVKEHLGGQKVAPAFYLVL